MKNRLYIAVKDDREKIVTILAVNGYTVKIGSDKINTKNRYYVEYWQNTQTEPEEDKP